MIPTPHRPTAVLLVLACAACTGGSGSAPTTSAPAGPRTVQPGAPGEQGRVFAGGAIERIEGASYTPADVAFMQGMIHHHAQALDMAALVGSRTDNESFHRMALRIDISQRDEIRMMQTWLRDRGQDAPSPGEHLHVMMPGMLSPEQMAQLDAARGVEFERAFLELMIQHHTGALQMVQELFATPGAAQESTINFFAGEVDADQSIEIQRMTQMLEQLR